MWSGEGAITQGTLSCVGYVCDAEEVCGSWRLNPRGRTHLYIKNRRPYNMADFAVYHLCNRRCNSLTRK